MKHTKPLYEIDSNLAYYQACQTTAEHVSIGLRCTIGLSTTPNITWDDAAVQKATKQHRATLAPYIMTYLPEDTAPYRAGREIVAALFAVRDIHKNAFSPLFSQLDIPEELCFTPEEEVEQHNRFTDFINRAHDRYPMHRAATYIAKHAMHMLERDIALIRETAPLGDTNYEGVNATQSTLMRKFGKAFLQGYTQITSDPHSNPFRTNGTS